MNNPRISLVNVTGNPNSRQAALALREMNFLAEVITTLDYNPKGFMANCLTLLPQKLKSQLSAELGRRQWTLTEEIPSRLHPWGEIIRIIYRKWGFNRYAGISNEAIMQWLCVSLDYHVANHHLERLTAIYSYEDIAATTFQMAKQQGILCLYDLPVIFYQMRAEIEADEARRFPQLASTLRSAYESNEKIARKEQEIKLADHIFVASSISRNSLLNVGVKAERITVIPYGAPVNYFYLQPKPDMLFRAIFVGSLGAHKGVHYLFKAWQELRLHNAELLLVGGNQLPTDWVAQYENLFRHVPSVPHASLNSYYSASNVLVFPSLGEGFGLVLLEAMACGIPVITTCNTGGPDIITDGVEGFIIPIRDVEALKEKIEWCYRHPKELAEMGYAARRKAEELTWDLYRQRLASQVQKLLKSHVHC